MFRLLALALLTLNCFAVELEVSSTGKQDGGPLLLKFSDGRVGFLDEASSEDLAGKIVDVELDENHRVRTLRVLGTAPAASPMKLLLESPDFDYRPTVFASYADTQRQLDTFSRNYLPDSQCYDRSHVWVYSQNYYFGHKLMKAFLFFSDDYIRRYNHRWWFHTAPYAVLRMNNQLTERVLDAGFSRYPLQWKIWTDLFMKNKVNCKVISKYSEYSTRPGEDDCYLIKAHMYFWQPKDLEAFELSGIQKTKFIDWEIRHSLREAFGIQ
jgi:hypothetical protein